MVADQPSRKFSFTRSKCMIAVSILEGPSPIIRRKHSHVIISKTKKETKEVIKRSTSLQQVFIEDELHIYTHEEKRRNSEYVVRQADKYIVDSALTTQTKQCNNQTNVKQSELSHDLKIEKRSTLERFKKRITGTQPKKEQPVTTPPRRKLATTHSLPLVVSMIII